MGASALSSIYTPLSESTGLTLDQLNVGSGYSYLFIGLSTLILQPAALSFGKRPVYVISIAAAAGLTAWTAFVQGNSQWIANRLLLGFFAGPSFSLVEVSIADVVSRALSSHL
jgi:MFS family permease